MTIDEELAITVEAFGYFMDTEMPTVQKSVGEGHMVFATAVVEDRAYAQYFLNKQGLFKMTAPQGENIIEPITAKDAVEAIVAHNGVRPEAVIEWFRIAHYQWVIASRGLSSVS